MSQALEWNVERAAKAIENLAVDVDTVSISESLVVTNELLERIALAIEKGNDQRYLDSLKKKGSAA